MTQNSRNIIRFHNITRYKTNAIYSCRYAVFKMFTNFSIPNQNWISPRTCTRLTRWNPLQTSILILRIHFWIMRSWLGWKICSWNSEYQYIHPYHINTFIHIISIHSSISDQYIHPYQANACYLPLFVLPFSLISSGSLRRMVSLMISSRIDLGSSTGTSMVLPRCWLYWSAHASL